ncbi:hypothetical protein P9112_003288 [Eukaryota sp. TZLM1-RC]
MFGFSHQTSNLELQDRVTQYSKTLNVLSQYQASRHGKSRIVSKHLTSSFREAALLSSLRRLEQKADQLSARTRLDCNYPMSPSRLTHAHLSISISLTATSPRSTDLSLRFPQISSSVSDVPLTLLDIFKSVSVEVYSAAKNTLIVTYPVNDSPDDHVYKIPSNESSFVIVVVLQPNTTTSLFKLNEKLLPLVEAFLDQNSRPKLPRMVLTLSNVIMSVMRYCSAKKLIGDDYVIKAGDDSLIGNLIAPHHSVTTQQLSSIISQNLVLAYPLRVEKTISIGHKEGLVNVELEFHPKKPQYQNFVDVDNEIGPLVDEALTEKETNVKRLENFISDPYSCLSELVTDYEDHSEILTSQPNVWQERLGKAFEIPKLSTWLYQRLVLATKNRGQH